MKNLLLLTIFFLGLNSSFASEYDWGQNGHRVTGKIAQNHLSKKAKKEIDKLLQGKSLAFVSTYGDEIKSDSKYREFGPWHYVNMPPGDTKYSVETANPDGDNLSALN